MSVVKCKRCPETFTTKGKRDRHTVNCHVLHVKIGENTLERKEDGFPCPVCVTYLKNASTLKNHLKKHQLSCDFILDFTVENPKELAIHDTPVSAATKVSIVQDVLKSSAIIVNNSSATPSANVLLLDVDASSDDNSVLGLEFAVPAEHDRLIFENIDLSRRFYDFQIQIKEKLEKNKYLTLEENIQHILALSSILLLKPGRTHADIHKHITFNQCENLLTHILSSNGITGQMLHCETKEKLERIVHKLIDSVSKNIISDSGKSLRLIASCEIAALIGEDPRLNLTNKILLAVRNMVEVLPRFVVEDGPQETELITRYLQASLVPLFENIDQNILFRWTSVSDDDKIIMLRPDASINAVYGATLDQRLGCGEVKPQYQALNHRLTGLDLVRIANLAKTASDKHKSIATLAFTVVGNHATFYVLHRAKANMYTMCEVEHIQLALKLSDIPLFIAQSSKIAKIISSFDYVLNCGTHNYDDYPATLTNRKLLEVTSSRSSCKRKSISSHYNH